MPRADSPGVTDRIERPGKTRTWWHPLLARLMDHLLSAAYTVQEEVSIGILPLRVDILLVRREGGQLSEACRRELSVLVPLLNRYTLIEFKCRPTRLSRGMRLSSSVIHSSGTANKTYGSRCRTCR